MTARAVGQATSYWASTAPMTDPRHHADWMDGLAPLDDAALRAMVASMIVHAALAEIYGVKIDEERGREVQLRPVADILDAVLRRSPATTPEERPVEARATGVCRNFVVLYVALLRSRGVPARARAGHASYFQDGRWIDHWVAERWDAENDHWIRTDPQLEDVQINHLGIDFDPLDLPDGVFLSGGETWSRVRDGQIDPETCGIEDMWGPHMVAGNVIRDLAALNKVELQPWDVWGVMLDPEPGASVRKDPSALDELAEVTASDDVDAIRRAYDDDRYRVPSVVTSLWQAKPSQVPVPT